MSWRVRSAALNGNLYVTSNRGILKSTSASAEFTLAGMPRCLDLQLSLSSAGTPVLLTDAGSSPTAGADQARGYRCVWANRDAKNNLVLGAPSSRFFIVNTAGATRDVSMTVVIPSEITTSHFLQVYVTATVDFGLTVDVGDEQRLVLEYFPTTTDITNGYLTIVDINPDAFRQADLYTNATQEGIAQQNTRPPLARDLCEYRGRLLLANYTEPHRLMFQLLGTAAMAAAQTITIGGVVLTAAASETVSTGTFQVFKPGGGGFTDKGTQALNVEYTAKSICNVINGYAAVTGFYAYYTSAVDDAPGAFMLEERGVGGSAFVAICSAAAIGNLFSPALPTTGSTYSSVAQRRKNRIRCSKKGEGEACPDGDDIIVGGEDEEIQRIIPLRASVIVIKDRSIWRLTEGAPGEEPVFIDNTVSIAGRDSAAELNNTVFFLSDQGFVSVTDNGVLIAGRPIERHVVAGLEAVDAPDHDRFVAIGHKTRRFYICAAYDPGSSEATCYVFSPIANKGKGAWTKRRLNASAFAVLDNRLLYALDNDNGHVLRQRASLRDDLPWYRDYCEDEATFTVTAVNTTEQTITGTLSDYVDYDDFMGGPGVGWKLYVGDAQYFVVAANLDETDDVTWTLHLHSMSGVDSTLIAQELTLLRPVEWDVEWAPVTGGNPLDTKQFGPAVLLKAETHDVRNLDFSFANQVDTKATPFADDWETAPPRDRVYVPARRGKQATASENDFALEPGSVVPFNAVTAAIPPSRAGGEHLSVRVSGGTAEGYVGIKALVVQSVAKDSNKGRP